MVMRSLLLSQRDPDPDARYAEWFQLMYKDKYAGEVYLELTFWSNVRAHNVCSRFRSILTSIQAQPPPKEQPVAASVMHPDYGGAGSFTPATNGGIGLGHAQQNTAGKVSAPHSRVSSSSYDESVPESLRPSSSLATLNLYKAEYDRPSQLSAGGGGVDGLANQMSEFGFGGAGARRRESFPVSACRAGTGESS